jgi:nitrogen fixation protein NifU and related proteins
MTIDLRDLYQDIILDHGQHPRNFRALEHPSHFANGHNPLCGDRVTVYVALDGDRIKEVSFQGRGCAISQASASLMTEILVGKTLAEAEALFKGFHAKVTGTDVPATPPELVDDIERLEPLTGVKAYPARVKCATLAWHAFEAALRNGATGATVKTE